MSREQWIEKLANDLSTPMIEAAASAVDDMIARGALSVGPVRTWTVVHDDPQAAQRYVFEGVQAPTPEIACRRGAYLAVLADPWATMGPGAWRGSHPSHGEREAVARAIVVASLDGEPRGTVIYATAAETSDVLDAVLDDGVAARALAALEAARDAIVQGPSDEALRERLIASIRELRGLES